MNIQKKYDDENLDILVHFHECIVPQGRKAEKEFLSTIEVSHQQIHDVIIDKKRNNISMWYTFANCLLSAPSKKVGALDLHDVMLDFNAHTYASRYHQLFVDYYTNARINGTSLSLLPFFDDDMVLTCMNSTMSIDRDTFLKKYLLNASVLSYKEATRTKLYEMVAPNAAIALSHFDRKFYQTFYQKDGNKKHQLSELCIYAHTIVHEPSSKFALKKMQELLIEMSFNVRDLYLPEAVFNVYDSDSPLEHDACYSLKEFYEVYNKIRNTNDDLLNIICPIFLLRVDMMLPESQMELSLGDHQDLKKLFEDEGFMTKRCPKNIMELDDGMLACLATSVGKNAVWHPSWFRGIIEYLSYKGMHDLLNFDQQFPFLSGEMLQVFTTLHDAIDEVSYIDHVHFQSLLGLSDDVVRILRYIASGCDDDSALNLMMEVSQLSKTTPYVDVLRAIMHWNVASPDIKDVSLLM